MLFIDPKAGESVTVNLYPELTDFTRTLLDGTKAAHVGDWIVSFGLEEMKGQEQGYDEMKLATY